MLDLEDSKDTGSFLLGLYRKALSLKENELYEYFLDHAVNITKSKIGFFHFVCSDQKTIRLTSWNKEALKNCTANYDVHYSIEQAGNWADCIRLKRPVIYNDFLKSPNQKGLPNGHVPIKRLLTIPIIEGGKVYGIFGVGNKEELYSKGDAVQLHLIANELNKIMKQRIAEAEIRESREKYRSLFQNMIDGFAYCKMIYDDQGKPVDFEYLEVNDAFERLTGLKKESVLGKRVTEAIPEIKEANPELFNIYGRVAQTGKEEKIEVYFKPLRIWLSISVYSPRKDYFAAVFENITERKKAEEALKHSENRYRSLFENGIDGIVLAKPDDGTILAANPQACFIFGMSQEEMKQVGRNALVVMDERFCSAFGKREKTGKTKGEITCRRKDGTTFEAEISSSLFADSDGTVKTSLIVRDITERKLMQKQLEEHSKNLEQLVEERTKQLKDAERLAAIGATAGMVGHDIRNPLQAITSDVYLLKSDLTGMPESETKRNAQESLEGIEKNIHYINKIVADLQDFARPLNPHVEEADIKLIIDELLIKTGLPENVKVKVKVESDAVKFVADSTYISRIMYNLVTNAVQAMPQGGKLSIHAYKEANVTVITVADTGVGIPEEAKGKLFTPMFTTKSKGQGFGLAVIKRMAEALSGNVTFESQEGKGTKFMIRLPPQERNGK